MNRLDQIIVTVRTKVTLRNLLTALTWSLSIFAGVVLVALLADKFFHGRLVPMPKVLFWAGLGVSCAIAVGYTIWRRPTKHQVAVAIDEKLGLQEKFSTALYIRPSTDPFAMAAVRDAEQTATRVNLQDKFGIGFPPQSIVTGILAIAIVLCSLYVPVRADRASSLLMPQNGPRAQVTPQESLRKALAEIYSAPPAVQEDPQIKMMKGEIEKALQRPSIEPAKARATAQEALKSVENIKEKIKNQQQFAKAENEMKMFRSMPGPTDTSTPVGKSHDLLKQGKFTEALNELSNAANNFEKMDKKEQEKNAEAAKQLAQQMQQKANDPAVQQQIQNQLQQLGANQQQAQQMAKQMQQAANGDKKAQQQLQQQANQMMQQMNNGKGPNAQQQQQINQAMQQMQQQANAQQNVANMAQAAQQLAQAMQQQAQAGQQGQQAQAQQGQPNGQNGNQQGQQNAQANAQQMQQAIQQMQAQNQAAQAAAAQQQANAQQGQGQQPGQGQQGQGQGQQGQGQWGQGQGQGQNQGQPQPAGQGGQGGPGIADGGARPKGEVAPFNIQKEVAPSQTDDKGKILAASFVKAASDPGKSEIGLQEVMAKEFTESTDEVEQDRIPAQAQKSVREYFDAVKNGNPAPGQ